MPRLSKVTKELNVGLQTCVDFLQKKGYAVENSLNAKIDDEQYELLKMGGGKAAYQMDEGIRLANHGCYVQAIELLEPVLKKYMEKKKEKYGR